MKRCAAVCVVLWIALGRAAAQSDDPAVVSTLQLPAKQILGDVLVEDLDGDGRSDLVICTHPVGARTRTLRVHRARAGEPAFASEPDFELRLSRDVVAFGTAEVHPDKGREILLFGATGAFVWRRALRGRGRLAKLVSANFLWQFADGLSAIAWSDGVRDLDGDGLDDLLLPEPSGYRVALQRRAPDGEVSWRSTALRVPRVSKRSARRDPVQMRGSMSERQLELRFSVFREDEETANRRRFPLLFIDDQTPAPRVIDFDGDGHLDVMAQGATDLFVWPGQKGVFSSDPSHRFPLPIDPERSVSLDFAFHADAGYFDGDRRADYLLFASDRNSDDVRTQVLLFLHGKGKGAAAKTTGAPLFGPKGVPQQLLILQGLAGSPQIVDVNGDGRSDLVVSAVRPDLIDRLRGASRGTIDVELHVYLNRGAGFPRHPDLTRRSKLAAETIGELGAKLVARFVGDVTGDGVSEFLLRDSATRLALLRGERRRRSIAIAAKPYWQLRVDGEARVRAHRAANGSRLELLVLEEQQLLHVRFR